MKCMLLYKLHPEKRHDAPEGFSEMSLMMAKRQGEQITLIGRWHDIAHSKVWLFLNQMVQRLYQIRHFIWNRTLDLKMSPFLDNSETKAVKKSGLHNRIVVPKINILAISGIWKV